MISNLRKQFCPKGHDKLIVGRTKDCGCQKCRQEYKNKWRQSHPEKFARARSQSRAWALRNRLKCRQYNWKRQGINCTIELYQKLFKEQDGCCKICGQSETALRIPLAVDHDHQTGRIRGLLCRGCNVKLGILEDVVFVASALSYLRRDM